MDFKSNFPFEKLFLFFPDAPALQQRHEDRDPVHQGALAVFAPLPSFPLPSFFFLPRGPLFPLRLGEYDGEEQLDGLGVLQGGQEGVLAALVGRSELAVSVEREKKRIPE